MTDSDTFFAGSIPALYDRYLVPMLFEPYARDLAERAAAGIPADILETAAGTGVVTRELCARLPEARIIATDLNQAMLDIAGQQIQPPNVRFQQADAVDLSFEDGTFDSVVCQFGVMFFPDRVRAYREARRVLRPGGRFLFNAWNRIEENPVTHILSMSLAERFPDSPPTFFRRGPHGYWDLALIERDLRQAGFENIASVAVEKRSRIGSAHDAAIGLCHGTPLRAELESIGPFALDQAAAAASAALVRLEGPDGVDAPMSAHIFTATA